jgi:hypothetical protein
MLVNQLLKGGGQVESSTQRQSRASMMELVSFLTFKTATTKGS